MKGDRDGSGHIDAGSTMWKFLRDERGAVIAYAAMFSAVALAAGALAVDFGRMAVLRTQMQDRADAGALAAAAQLDGRDAAMTRATTMAMNAMAQESGIAADGTTLSVAEVNFYSEIDPDKVAATSDLDAKYAEVTLQPRQVDFYLAPLMGLFSAEASDSGTVNATAVAKPSPFICEAPPLMVCDLKEENPALDLSLASNIGKQLRLKEPQAGSSPAAPGNFGLLALPDGSSGANDIEAALAAVSPPDCYTLDVTTAQGSKTNKVRDGINARFDLPGVGMDPAPNVINFPRDVPLDGDPDVKMGDGDWRPEDYWPAMHNGVPLPGDLAGASRYQVYLYELGLSFARNGKQTLYPVDGSPPDGYTMVNAPGADVPATLDPFNDDDGDGLVNEEDPDQDGVPQNTPAGNGYKRRLVKVAVLECIANNVHGHGTYPTDGNYLEMFLTEQVSDPPQAAIYGEIVRPLSTTNDPDFHANVRLVR